jgi:hypothetical protein
VPGGQRIRTRTRKGGEGRNREEVNRRAKTEGEVASPMMLLLLLLLLLVALMKTTKKINL